MSELTREDYVNIDFALSWKLDQIIESTKRLQSHYKKYPGMRRMYSSRAKEYADIDFVNRLGETKNKVFYEIYKDVFYEDGKIKDECKHLLHQELVYED